MTWRRSAVAVPLLAAAFALGAAGSVTAAPEDIYDTYREDGLISGCSYSAADLREALATIPADVRAYDPGFADAVGLALEQRAGGCEGSPDGDGDAEAGGAVSADDGSPGPAAPLSDPPAAAPEDRDGGGVPALVLAVAGLGAGLLVLGAMPPGRRGRPSRRVRLLAEPFHRLGDRAWVARHRLRPRGGISSRR